MYAWQDRFDVRLGGPMPKSKKHSEAGQRSAAVRRWIRANQDNNPVSKPRRFSWEAGEE